MNANAAVAVEVGLGERAYDILIGPGLLSRAGAEMSRRLPGRRAAVVTDENVAAAHLHTLKAGLLESGIEPAVITLPPGEKTKSFAHLEAVVDGVLAAKLERGDVVIALGGGVIGDLAGFAAGIVRRGMNFVQIPTSLLAQVDSSVGGKTGINSARGKNLVGVFHQPKLVLADTGVLDTLPIREFRAGYAELAKYGLIDRPEFFAWLEKNWARVFAGGPERVEAIAEACRAKADVVARDEFETGDRALLNLGHTFGHALEAATRYDGARLVHGEGVAIGMALAHRFSSRLNLASPDDAARVEAHLNTVGLPWRMADIPGELPDADALLGFITQDKKVSRGALTFILTRGIGEAFIAKDVPASEVLSFLRENHPSATEGHPGRQGSRPDKQKSRLDRQESRPK
ncbi:MULTISPECIES: 3-dehydroquinate synthase [unclassified Mesorhizobium]|uniref:3-dehydroquinate synthase n=1 Tax=unclassified Mesorhizobium TaxID=325217 RepID=UPI001FEEB40E|nr:MULTISPECIES: 3-dehydroquinate synthase [unclassified Mesorhizobium]